MFKPLGIFVLLAWFAAPVLGGSFGKGTPSDRPTLYPLEAYSGAVDEALILWPGWTGLNDPIAILDPAILSPARRTLFYTDDPKKETRMVLLSILFLSPPGNGTRKKMATLLTQQGAVHFDCFTMHCSSKNEEWEQNLSGLIEHGLPVSAKSSRVRNAEDYAAQFKAISESHSHFFDTSPKEPDWARDWSLRVDLPTIILYADENGNRASLDQSKIETAILERLPTDVRLNHVSIHEFNPDGIARDREQQRALRVEDALVKIDTPTYFTPTIRLYGTENALKKLDHKLFEGLPLPPSQDDKMDAEFEAAIIDADPSLDPKDYGIVAYGYVEETKVNTPFAPSAYLSWYEVSP